MAFIYDLSDTWNNAGISWNGIKLNVTDAASAAGSKLLDLQIGSASKFTVGKTGTVTATGIIESTVGGFRFPDGTTQITRAVTSVTSTDGSVAITGTTSVDLSAVFATSASNLLLPVRNTTGATLTKGTAVYISGATGQISTVSKAIATGDATSAQTLGLVTANIANNANGNVTLIGTITNIDTSAYADGQQLYLSPTTAGTLTATKPYAPQHLVYMAVVEHAHPTQGKLFVKVQNGYELDELHDVSAQSPSNNHGIFYNTATSLWENKSIITALGYTPYNATNPAGYTTNVGTVTSVSGTGTVNGLTLTGSVTTSGSLTLGGTLGNIANSQLTNSAITINGTSTALGGSISVGTVTSVAALTLGTSGTDLASSVANGTTTPVITLNVPTASASNRGALSSSDWSTFNAKQAALVSGTNIKTVGGASLLGSGDVGTIGLAYGGTGATTASGARTALGLGTAAVLNAGVAGGVATLDGSGTVPTSQLPGAVLGGLNYQGTWNASTNTPTLASSTGSKGYYYVVSVAGSTNLNGITDWKIGDWAVYDGTTWQKVDNTDAVSSVNGYTGAVVLTTSDVAQGTNLYFTQAAARGSVSAGTGISYNSTTGVITNSAPDQTVALTGAGTTTVTGTYPNFTITSNDSTVGTVTSVAASGGTTGLTFTGSPITTAGTLTLGGTLAVANGGTGATTLTSGYLVKGNGASAVSASVVYDDGTNVGIGTTSPAFKLQVNGTIRANSGDVQAYQGAISTYGVAGTAAIKLFQNSGNWEINNPGGYLQFYDATAAAERMRITSAGNVGIGTSSPGQKLSVAGNTLIPLTNSYFCYTNDYGIGTPDSDGLQVFASNGDKIRFGHRTLGTTFTEDMRIGSNGYVGINTASPAARLHVVNSTVNAQLRLQDVTTDATNKYGVVGTGHYTNAQSPILAVGVGSLSASNTVYIGGGFGSLNAATAIQFFTAANNTTLTGTERMRIDASGNVGIGTSAPTEKLVLNSAGSVQVATKYINGNTTGVSVGAGADGSAFVYQAAALPFIVYTNATERMRIASDGTTTLSIGGVSSTHQFNYNESGGEIQLIDSTGAGPILLDNVSGLARLYKVGTGAMSIGTTGANYLQFITNGSERVRIDSSGNVGIGTSSPITRLHAASTSDGEIFRVQRLGGSNLTLLRVNMSETNNTGTIDVTAAAGNPAMVFATASSERARIDSSGNLLVGTTSGSGAISVARGAGVSAIVEIAGNGNTIGSTSMIVGQDTSSNAYCWNRANAVLLFGTNNTERARIDTSGNLLVGCTSTAFASGQNTGIYLTNTTGGSGGLHIKNTANNTGTNVVTFYGWNDTQTGSILTYVNVTNYNTSSDARLKENVSDADSAASLIDAIQVRKFDWKSDGTHQRYGMVAQELVTVAPEAVSQPEDPDEMMGVDYSKLVPMLIKEVQSLRARVAQLEGN